MPLASPSCSSPTSQPSSSLDAANNPTLYLPLPPNLNHRQPGVEPTTCRGNLLPTRQTRHGLAVPRGLEATRGLAGYAGKTIESHSAGRDRVTPPGARLQKPGRDASRRPIHAAIASVLAKLCSDYLGGSIPIHKHTTNTLAARSIQELSRRRWREIDGLVLMQNSALCTPRPRRFSRQSTRTVERMFGLRRAK